VTDRDAQARIEELLMQRVTGALSAPEASALAQLLAQQSPSQVRQWEETAAELAAALSFEARSPDDVLPPALADKITGVGEAFVRTSKKPPAMSAAPSTPVVPIVRARARSRLVNWGGWLAAAAMLAVWVAGSRGPLRSNQDTPAVGPAVSLGAQLRDSLLNADSALVRLSWATIGDSSALGATGDVVWSSTAQRGVMRIAGLQPNDGKRWQYQLWIFDKKRDQRYPVDGGVFDIPAGAHEVFVPIDARLPVGEAVMFAVTVEPPGGVVVSTRERIALLAKGS
jgi:anti-sigma-K factor RskA